MFPWGVACPPPPVPSKRLLCATTGPSFRPRPPSVGPEPLHFADKCPVGSRLRDEKGLFGLSGSPAPICFEFQTGLPVGSAQKGLRMGPPNGHGGLAGLWLRVQ